MTKNQLKYLACTFILVCGGRVSALSLFECVRELIPISEPAATKGKRDGVERPFLAAGKYLVFPEAIEHHLAGFYVYLGEQAWYYDAVEKISSGDGITLLKDLPPYDDQIYKMVAQPTGLETLTLEYMPGFLVESKKRAASEVLGASVLPVVGAFVSRPSVRKEVYNSPKDVPEEDLRAWVYNRLSRRPASASSVVVPRQIVHLRTQQAKSGEALWKPLKAEYELRKNWIQNHNLAEASFRRFSFLLAGVCRVSM